MNEFAFAPEARSDLVTIWNYYALEVGDSDLADRMRDEIFRGVRKIVRNPGLGHVRRDLAAEPLKFWRVRRYLIVYRAKPSLVEIVRVLHGARDIATILGDS